MRDQRLLREVNAGRGGKATILFAPFLGVVRDRFEADFVVLTNGGVLFTDGDGAVRWHPSQNIDMVIWKGEEEL